MADVALTTTVQAPNPAVKAIQEFRKSNAAWEKSVTAFHRLPAADQKDIVARIGAAYRLHLKNSPNLNQAQEAEDLWSIQANEVATWAGDKARQALEADLLEADPEAARILGALYYGANAYLIQRNAYLGDHDGLKGAVGSVNCILVDGQGKVQIGVAPAAARVSRERQLAIAA